MGPFELPCAASPPKLPEKRVLVTVYLTFIHSEKWRSLFSSQGCGTQHAMEAVWRGVTRWVRWAGLDVALPFYRIDRDIARFAARRGTMPDLLEAAATRHPSAPLLVAPIGAGGGGGWREWTYGEVAAEVNAVAAGLASAGVGRGDSVAILLPTTPAYVVVWMAVSRLGATAALVNPRVRGASLAHCITVAGATAAVISRDFACNPSVAKAVVDAVRANARGGGAGGHKDADCRLWWANASAMDGGSGEGDGAPVEPFASLAALVSNQPPPPLNYDTAGAATATADRKKESPGLHALMFTSGTTGLPKPARITHTREASGGIFFGHLSGILPSDRL